MNEESEMTKIVFSHKTPIVGEHNVDHGVIGCMDFRLRDARAAFMKSMGVVDYDNCVMPGACKNHISSESGCAQLELAVNVALGLHSGEHLWLFHHTDCGAYGGSAEFDSLEEEIEFQSGELMKTRDKIKLAREGEGKPVPVFHLFVEVINKDGGSVDYIEVI